MFENIMFKVQKVRFMFIQARCDVFGSPERTGNIVGGAERHRETLRDTERPDSWAGGERALYPTI